MSGINFRLDASILNVTSRFFTAIFFLYLFSCCAFSVNDGELASAVAKK